jgi:UDPglucose 6-dehydrogenase
VKIGIVGLGFVGLSFAVVLGYKGIKVIGIDKNKHHLELLKQGKSSFFEKDLEKLLKIGIQKKLEFHSSVSKLETCDLIFVTVGTPQKVDGSIDLSMIEDVSKKIGNLIKKSGKKPMIIIKSTVIPGTAQKVKKIIEKTSDKKNTVGFELISNPEFLRESQAIEDTKNPHIVVIGGESKNAIKKISGFYNKLHDNVPIIKTNSQTAEMIKYANNSFLATKISFINQIAKICENIPGVNIEDVSKSIGSDPRIGKLFLNAGPGYGGSCLPKDVKAMIYFSNKVGVNPSLLNSVEKINEEQIQHVINSSKKLCGTLKSKKITILGLSFKPNTDDIRDSISLEIIKKLLRENAIVTVHDPKALENVKKIFKEKIQYSSTISKALEGSDIAIIMTAWPEYKKITNSKLKLMKKPIIVDTRRILDSSKLKCKYFGIGFGNDNTVL